MADIHSLMEATIKVLFDKICLMVMVISIGQMELNIRGNGKMDINKG